jgi:hypothetical protein
MSSASPDRTVYILDSYAVLGYLQGEAAGQRVRDILRQARARECRIYL